MYLHFLIFMVTFLLLCSNLLQTLLKFVVMLRMILNHIFKLLASGGHFLKLKIAVIVDLTRLLAVGVGFVLKGLAFLNESLILVLVML